MAALPERPAVELAQLGLGDEWQQQQQQLEASADDAGLRREQCGCGAGARHEHGQQLREGGGEVVGIESRERDEHDPQGKKRVE
eukprot:940726-Rhodomonas_salina.3